MSVWLLPCQRQTYVESIWDYKIGLMHQEENQAPESTLAPENIARLMQNLRRGSTQAAGQLIAAFYPELRRMARARMKGERTPHTWQPTIIVNELYLEMVRIKALRPGDGTKTDR